MSEHVCHFVYGGAHCTRPVSHSLCVATIVDGNFVRKAEYWMCEECFNAFEPLASDADWQLKS